jgi:hypothetical protein
MERMRGRRSVVDLSSAISVDTSSTPLLSALLYRLEASNPGIHVAKEPSLKMAGQPKLKTAGQRFSFSKTAGPTSMEERQSTPTTTTGAIRAHWDADTHVDAPLTQVVMHLFAILGRLERARRWAKDNSLEPSFHDHAVDNVNRRDSLCLLELHKSMGRPLDSRLMT